MTGSALSMYLQVRAALYVSCSKKKDEIEKTRGRVREGEGLGVEVPFWIGG